MKYARGGQQIILYIETLGAARSGDRVPVKARFAATVQTGPWTHTASSTMNTESLPRG
jgi:hypothetical protein